MLDFFEEIRDRLRDGDRPSEVWSDLLRRAEHQSAAEFNAHAAEWSGLAELFPDEERVVSRKAYCHMTEIDTGDREGPQWQFDSYLHEPAPIFRLARYAYHDFSNGVDAWLNFVARRQIRHWHFEGLRYRSAAELKPVFSDEYFRDSTGATLTWISAEDEAMRSLFSRPGSMRHWKVLRFEWLRSDEKSSFEKWFSLFADTELRRFSLQSCNPGEEGFRALARSPFLTGLEDLELLNVVLGSPECEILLQSKYIPRRLKRLKLDDCSLSNGKPEIDGATFVKLIQSQWFSCLEELENHYHTIGYEGIAALVASPSRTTLRYLSLHNSRLGDEGLKTIFDNSWPNLRGIYISYDHFSPALMATLKSTPLYAQCPQVSIFPMEGDHIYKER